MLKELQKEVNHPSQESSVSLTSGCFSRYEHPPKQIKETDYANVPHNLDFVKSRSSNRTRSYDALEE